MKISAKAIDSRARLFGMCKLGCALLCAALVAGCAATPDAEPYDPYESTNRRVFAFNNALDRYVLAPASKAYAAVTPDLVQYFVYNFFDNLTYPLVVANGFLQGKVQQGMSDTGRFVFNSTLGLGGLIDVSSPMGLERHQEDLGQTLAVWGVPAGPYLELPLFGPNTLRTTPNLVVGRAANPLTYTDSVVSLPLSLLSLLETRVRLDPAIRARDTSSIDAYVFQREAYLQRRRHLVYDGNPPDDDDEFDIFDDEDDELEIEVDDGDKTE